MRGIYTETSTWIWTASGGWQKDAAFVCVLVGVVLLMGAVMTIADGANPGKPRRPSTRRKVAAAALVVLALGSGVVAAPILHHTAPRESRQGTSTRIVAAGRMMIMGENVEGRDLRVRIAENPNYLLVLDDPEDIARLSGRQDVEVRLNCEEGPFRGQLNCRGEEPNRPPQLSPSAMLGLSEAIPKDAALKSTCSTPYAGMAIGCAA